MGERLLVKVCGNTSTDNLLEVGKLQPDFIGFIFYSKSIRHVVNPKDVIQPTHCKAKRVGVFVNADMEVISEKIIQFDLDYVQLHGDETPEYCAKINGIKPVFKAFQVNDRFNFNILKSYISSCYYFLFDTTSNQYGGSGKKFEWSILGNYTYHKPFILSGGITDDDVENIKRLDHPQMIGIDLNSRFEISPGIKDTTKLSTFLTELKS